VGVLRQVKTESRQRWVKRRLFTHFFVFSPNSGNQGN
jgi:hypothetical protein